MLDRLRSLFNQAEAEPKLDPAVAATALLFEVAWADHDISEKERKVMQRVLLEQFDVPAERFQQILEETEQTHKSSVGVFPFTRAINEQLDQDEKVSIIQAMWQIAYADRSLDVFEEHTIRRISDLLYVSHSDFIAAKLAVRR